MSYPHRSYSSDTIFLLFSFENISNADIAVNKNVLSTLLKERLILFFKLKIKMSVLTIS